MNCHLHVEVVPLTSVADEGAHEVEQVESWLDRKWEEKEKELDYFAKHQTFDSAWTQNQVGKGVGDER